MLHQLEDPSALGPAIAMALITTLYGVLMAYLVFLPMADKLSKLSQDEVFMKQVMMEGIIMVADNESIAFLRQKLQSFLTPDMDTALLQLEEGGDLEVHAKKFTD